jgi:hypothetical protein
MRNSIVTLINRRHDDANHFAFGPRNLRLAIHDRPVHINVRSKGLRVETVNLENVVNQIVLAVPFPLIEFAQQTLCVMFLNRFDPSSRRRRCGVVVVGVVVVDRHKLTVAARCLVGSQNGRWVVVVR